MQKPHLHQFPDATEAEAAFGDRYLRIEPIHERSAVHRCWLVTDAGKVQIGQSMFSAKIASRHCLDVARMLQSIITEESDVYEQPV